MAPTKVFVADGGRPIADDPPKEGEPFGSNDRPRSANGDFTSVEVHLLDKPAPAVGHQDRKDQDCRIA
jgi:hypothetical protein